ncbi:MAG: hypothetical protein JXI33_10340 [Candidatus Aminicenantes bacterium]|nr:hypothetical protein [Candidatus Aminicenantes bacterium]
MKFKVLVLIIAALAMASCNALENESTSGSMLQIISLTGNDLEGNEGSATVFSDVITNNSIFNDNCVVEIRALPLDPYTPDLKLTPYMDVLVDQIDVKFERTDGRNVEGVDVPYRFTQPVNQRVSITGTIIKIPFVLIRHVAKMEAPLLALREIPSQEFVLQLVATVTIHGKDLGGHRVAPVSGYISVWCANFADPDTEEPEPEPEP